MGWIMLTVKSRTMHTDEIIECLNWCYETGNNMYYCVVMSNKGYHVGGTHNTSQLGNIITPEFIERIRSRMEYGYINAWDNDKNKLLQFKLVWG